MLRAARSASERRQPLPRPDGRLRTSTVERTASSAGRVRGRSVTRWLRASTAMLTRHGSPRRRVGVQRARPPSSSSGTGERRTSVDSPVSSSQNRTPSDVVAARAAAGRGDDPVSSPRIAKMSAKSAASSTAAEIRQGDSPHQLTISSSSRPFSTTRRRRSTSSTRSTCPGIGR